MTTVDCKADFDAIHIAFFHGRNVSDYEIYSVASIDDIAKNKAFDKERQTILYIHGFRENLESESVETVVKAFITRGSHNILVLDWSSYATGNYVLDAVPNLVKVCSLLQRMKRIFN